MKKAKFLINARGRKGRVARQVSGYTHTFHVPGWAVPVNVGFDKRSKDGGKPLWYCSELGTGAAMAVAKDTRIEAQQMALTRLQMAGLERFKEACEHASPVTDLPKEKPEPTTCHV